MLNGALGVAGVRHRWGVPHVAPRVVNGWEGLVRDLAAQRFDGQHRGRWPRSSGDRVLDSPLHRLYALAGAVGDSGKLAGCLENRRDVEVAVFSAAALQGAVPWGHAVRGDIGDNQHRRASEARLDHAEQPGGGGVATLRHEHPRLTGQPAIHVGHARRCLLVTCQHDSDFVLLAVQSLENLTGVAAGKSEDVIYTCLFEHIDNFIYGGACRGFLTWVGIQSYSCTKISDFRGIGGVPVDKCDSRLLRFAASTPLQICKYS